jgi:hypothetical protein
MDEHPYSSRRHFPLLTDPVFLANLYHRAKRVVLSTDALEFALKYSSASTQKKPLYLISVDKMNPNLGPDLLSRRQRALENLVPRDPESVELWEWDFDIRGDMIKIPSRLHLEWLCWGYTPDQFGIWECSHREFGDRLNGVL